jgi:hypothetical protein
MYEGREYECGKSQGAGCGESRDNHPRHGPDGGSARLLKRAILTAGHAEQIVEHRILISLETGKPALECEGEAAGISIANDSRSDACLVIHRKVEILLAEGTLARASMWD